MRHRNSVRQLGKSHSHRRAMFANMTASFYINERVITTKEKAKELKRISEKLITRARRNFELPEKEVGKKLHNKRIVMNFIKNREAVTKLFDDIAGRYLNRKGGYTRIYLLGRREGDAAEMAILELVDKKQVEIKSKGQPKGKVKEKEKEKAKDREKDKEKSKEKPKSKKETKKGKKD